MKVKTIPEIKGNKLPLIYYGNKKQQMYVLSLIGSSLKPATQPQPWPSPSKENKLAVNAVGKKNMVNHWYYSWLWHLERIHKDKLTFKYEHKHSDKKSIAKKSCGLKEQAKKKQQKKKLMDGSCESLLSWLQTPASQSEGVSPCRTVPVVVCCPLWCCSLQKHLQQNLPGKPQRPLFSIPGIDLAPLTMTSLGGWCGKQKCPRQPSVKRKNVLPPRSFWSSCPLVSFTHLFFLSVINHFYPWPGQTDTLVDLCITS